MTAPTTGSSAAPDPHRLTPTQRLHEVTLAALNRKPAESECSVELTRNAKGHIQIAIVSRSTSMMMASDMAQAEFDALCVKYPYPTANGGTE